MKKKISTSRILIFFGVLLNAVILLGLPHAKMALAAQGYYVTYSQTISKFSFSPATLVVGGTSTASATASSGLTVSFLSTTPTICAVSGVIVTGLKVGACSVVAYQSGNSTYSAAPVTTQDIAVNMLSITNHYYTSILNRVADSAGEAFWQGEVARMGSLGVSAKEAYIVMAMGFFRSPEFLARGFTDDQFVRNLYLTFFIRESDQDGLNYWKGLLASGLPRDMVMYAFMFSTEFDSFMTQVAGATSQRAEVATVIDYYRGVLGRLPENDGFTYWVNQFRSAQCSSNPTANFYAAATSIAASFFGSSEYNSAGPTPGKYVADLYNAFMRRSGDLSGYNYWVDQITTGAQSRDQVRKAYIDSPEFAARVQAVSGQGCVTLLK